MIYIFIILLTLVTTLLSFLNLFIKKFPNKLSNIAVLFCFICIVMAVLMNLIIVKSTYNKKGFTGKIGISGAQGERGNPGRCDTKCGMKVCYLNVVEKAQEYFKTKVKDENKSILNKWFLNLINNICNSDGYYNTLTSPHHNKPTEQKLIKYIENIICKWIDLILKSKDGIFFLASKNVTQSFLSKSLLTKIKKYDVYRWTIPDSLKKKKILVKSNNLQLPIADQSKLYVLKSNNYKQVYNVKTKTDIWNADECPYDQMGVKKDNPNNLSQCIYIDPVTYKKQYKNTWKTSEYGQPPELSLYNTTSYKNDKGQIFYPVGSVWRGKNSNERPENITNYPASTSMCGDGHGIDRKNKFYNEGPEKETILVSGDVTDPESFEKIWDSKLKCPECQTSHTQIYRPISKKGYRCLGDVAINWHDDSTESGKRNRDRELENLQIKCVPESCVIEKNIETKVYSNKNMKYKKFNNYKDYISKKSNKSNKQLPLSIWDAGSSNIGEEINNRYGINLNDNGGYNLFRASQHYNKKDKSVNKFYVIKKECTLPNGGKKPSNIKLNVKSNINLVEERYNTSKYFGEKPQQAILTNIYKFKKKNMSIAGPYNDRKKFYLIDDLTQRQSNKPDTFFIKTLNTEENDYSSCLVFNPDDIYNVEIANFCEKENDLNKWVVNYDNSQNEVVNSTNVSISPKLRTDLCLVNYYDENGKNKNILQKRTNNNYWKYSTLLPEELPNK